MKCLFVACVVASSLMAEPPLAPQSVAEARAMLQDDPSAKVKEESKLLAAKAHKLRQTPFIARYEDGSKRTLYFDRCLDLHRKWRMCETLEDKEEDKLTIDWSTKPESVTQFTYVRALQRIDKLNLLSKEYRDKDAEFERARKEWKEKMAPVVEFLHKEKKKGEVD